MIAPSFVMLHGTVIRLHSSLVKLVILELC